MKKDNETKRTTDDICLLCEKNKSTKKNSHIVSKFLAESILEASGKRRAHIIGSSYIDKRVYQDSPKEDYILCPDCEKYFELLETYISNNFFNRILNSKFDSNFQYSINQGGVEYAICLNLDTRLLRLFIISLFWRCSISSIEPFKQFQIADESILKNLLAESITTDYKNLLIAHSSEELFSIPMVLLTPKSDVNFSANYLYASNSNREPYQLMLNNFMLFISLEKKQQADEMFEFLVNKKNDNIIVGIIRDATWNDLRIGLVQMAAKMR